MAPAKTSPDVLEKLQAAVGKALAQPKLRSAMEADGALPSYLPGKQFTDFTAAELKRWGEVVRGANVKAE